MQRASAYKAAGLFMVILGSMVMGIATGMGLVAFMVKSRLPCVPMDGTASACQDIVGPAMDMILVSAVGGFAAFGAGLLAVALVTTKEQPEVNDD